MLVLLQGGKSVIFPEYLVKYSSLILAMANPELCLSEFQNTIIWYHHHHYSYSNWYHHHSRIASNHLISWYQPGPIDPGLHHFRRGYTISVVWKGLVTNFEKDDFQISSSDHPKGVDRANSPWMFRPEPLLVMVFVEFWNFVFLKIGKMTSPKTFRNGLPLILDEPGYFLPWPISEFSESTLGFWIVRNFGFWNVVKTVHEGEKAHICNVCGKHFSFLFFLSLILFATIYHKCKQLRASYKCRQQRASYL